MCGSEPIFLTLQGKCSDSAMSVSQRISKICNQLAYKGAGFYLKARQLNSRFNHLPQLGKLQPNYILEYCQQNVTSLKWGTKYVIKSKRNFDNFLQTDCLSDDKQTSSSFTTVYSPLSTTPLMKVVEILGNMIPPPHSRLYTHLCLWD